MHQGSRPGPRLAPPGVVTANIIKIRINRNRNLTSKALEAAYGGYYCTCGKRGLELLTDVAEVGRVNTLNDELPDGEAVLPIFQYLYLSVFTAPPPRLLAHIWSSKFRLGASKYQSLMDDCFATMVSRRLKSISIMDKMC